MSDVMSALRARRHDEHAQERCLLVRYRPARRRPTAAPAPSGNQARAASGAFAVDLEINGTRLGAKVADPFARDQKDDREARLEWYFEQWLRFPMLDTKKAAAAAASVHDYGDALFEQLFAGPRS